MECTPVGPISRKLGHMPKGQITEGKLSHTDICNSGRGQLIKWGDPELVPLAFEQLLDSCAPLAIGHWSFSALERVFHYCFQLKYKFCILVSPFFLCRSVTFITVCHLQFFSVSVSLSPRKHCKMWPGPCPHPWCRMSMDPHYLQY